MSTKHPPPEELVSWVYGEETNRKQIGAHLKECAACRAQADMWLGTMEALDQMPAPAAPRRFATAPWQWAAAAALFLALGIAIGGFAFSNDETNVRVALQHELQQQVAAMRADLEQQVAQRDDETVARVVAANIERLGAEFTGMLEQARSEDRATYLLALKELNAKHDAEVAALKKGLETVVALADYGFEATEERLAQLAASTQNTRQE